MRAHWMLRLLMVGILSFCAPLYPTSVDAASQNAYKKTAAKSLNQQQFARSWKKNASKKQVTKKTSTTPDASKYAAVVVDATTGYVLYEENADKMRYPASLTKMMTLYLTFDAMKHRKLSLNTAMTASKRAAAQPETNINLKEGSKISVSDAIKALVVRSGNDAAVVLAEQIGGTQWTFAQMMTKKARELGMRDTVFRNPHGLPDDAQYTSAFDMARLSIALRRDFPEYYHFFKTDRFSFNGTNYTSHNRVMKRYNGVDGIKTGYIRASGFNLATSVQKDGRNLVAVVMGGKSSTSRDDLMIKLLDRTFADLNSKSSNNVASANSKISYANVSGI